MRPEIILLFLLVGCCHVFQSNGQLKDSDLYEVAYNYLNDSILTLDDIKALTNGCEDLVRIVKTNGKTKKTKLKFDTDLQVAYKFNNHRRGFPLEDFVIKKYNLSNDCMESLRIGTRTCHEVNTITDSLTAFWNDYSMQQNDEIKASLTELPSSRKDGYQVFFSDIYKNTLSAEVKSFCTSYDLGNWQGSSIFFFFVFSDQGEIKEVYSGRTIHYN